jgi:subtilase family serine protease
VENSGQADFMGRFYVAMFVDGILIADIPVEGLAAGGATTVAARWTASPGAHLFRAVADVGNTVDENNETDNEIHRTGASVEQPDLRVRDVMAVKGPGQEGNDAFTVFAVLENIGGATLRPITVEALADASVLGDTQLGGLPARTATQVSLPVHSLNPQWLTVVADPDATIQEHDEYDNAASADFSPLLEVAGARPDLTVSEISVPMTGLTDGQPTAVFVTIDNTGNATLMGGVDVRLSTTDGFDSQTTLYGLLAGESAVMGFPWTASGGTTAFDASVNTGRVQPEWSFEDNQLGRKISTMLPDYKISSLVRWNSTEGLEAPIFAVVENAGTGDTVRSTTLDVFIGGVLHLQQGFNGLCSGGQMTIPIRWAAVSGARDIRLEVDRQRQTPESDEGNNMLLDEIYTEYPDLSVTNISWAPHPDNVSLLTVYAEVQNTGTGSTARPLQVSHDTDSYGLDSVTIYGLPANSSTVITWKWALLAGEHVFTVDADVSDAVHESDENNNRLVVEYPSGRARPPPQSLNILIDNVTYRQSANKTGNITQNILTVVLSVHNNGQQDLPASFAAFFADSLLVVEIAVPPLAVNSTAVFAYPWNATVSNHTVKVMVDYRHQFPEDVETDNELSVFIEENNPPTVDAGGNRSVLVGQPVTFKGYGNDPIDGYIALYEWDFNGDGTYDYNSTVSPTVTHVYYSNGTYIVRLRVTDDRGATSVSSAILVVKLKDEKPFLRADELTFAAIILAISVLAAAAVLIYRKRDEQ